ncbi:MAG TPA: SPOR domain-containing protein, partial [Rhodoferax sp.]
YNHSRAAMMTAVANNKTLVQACVELSRHASSRERFIRILVVNLAWIALASMAYVLLPSNNPSALPASAEPLAVPALSRASRPTRATEPAVSAAEPTASAASAARATASATEPPASDVATAASAPVKVASASALSVTSTASAAPQALPFASAPAQARSKAVSASAVAASKEAPLPQPAAEMNAKSTASAAAQTEEVYVNAGLFADPDNARRTLARLIEVGLPATAQELQTSHGVRTRVRVGPFANQAHAELAVRHIKAMNLDAVLAKP